MDTPVFLEYTSSAVPILNELVPEQLEYNSKHEIKTPNLLAKYLFYLSHLQLHKLQHMQLHFALYILLLH